VEKTSHSSQVAAWAAREGLDVKTMGVLKKYPGSLHWHFKRGRERGTIELTLVPKDARGWFSMRPGRAHGWKRQEVEDLLTRLILALRR